MSAIGGVFRFDGAPVARDAIGGMLEALRPFGEEPHTWAPESPASPVALGCRPRRVTPEDAYYRPPLHSVDGRLVLVADARIDNRAELGPALGISHRESAQLPDAAFILAAYQTWETESPRHLIGDFAFALWDQRHQRLFCARDGMGLRVLYYHVSAQRIAFATAPFALTALGDVPSRLNEQKVAETLVLYQDPESTFFSGVKRLLPGHTLVAAREGVRSQRFWAPAPAHSPGLRSDQEFLDGFIDVFDRAVAARIRSAGPVGVLLSGGLDSTSVAATAAIQLGRDGRRLHAFHAAPRVGFGAGERPGWTADESEEVEAVSGCHPNLDLRIHRTDGRSPFDSDFTLFQMAGLPPRNPNNLSWFAAVYAAAQTQQVRVLLNGNHGNPTISYDGIRSLRDMARRGHWGYVFREVRCLARASGRKSRLLFRQQVLWPLIPPWLSKRGGMHSLEQARQSITAYSAIHPDLVSGTRVDERVAAEGADSIKARRAGGLEYRIAALQSPADSPDLANGCRAWFGIETREPATDQRVIEYCLSVPPPQYLRDGQSRWLIRRAMRDRLPASVLDRTTRGSQAGDWTEWFPRMRGQIGAELERLERSDTARRCLDLARLRSLMANCPEPLRLEHRRTYVHLVLRGLTMGRFIRWFEETYG